MIAKIFKHKKLYKEALECVDLCNKATPLYYNNKIAG